MPFIIDTNEEITTKISKDEGMKYSLLFSSIVLDIIKIRNPFFYYWYNCLRSLRIYSLSKITN